MGPRFNHVELTVAPGALDATLRADLAAFYGDVLGWDCHDLDVPEIPGMQFIMHVDDGQFILVAEHERPMSSPGYDHLGLLYETRAEVDEVLATCQALQERDPRMQLKLYDDSVYPTATIHAFYFKYLLPIWLDVQVIERPPGTGPARRWQYV